MGDMLSRAAGFFAELRRRRIFHVAAVYAATAFVVAQVAAILTDALFLPDRTLTVVVVLLILGFPVALVLTWAFEVTPEGVRRTPAFAADGDGDGGSQRMLRATFLALTLLLTAGVGWGAWEIFLRPGTGEGAATSSAGSYDPTRVAVLYFDDFSPGGELRYFADGLTESLIHELAQVEALDVVSRNGVKPYRDGRVTQDSVVKALGVGSLVQGSVLRSGGDVRVTIQLIDGASGTHLGSREIRRSWADRLELQDELAVAAAEIIRRRLGVEVRLRQHRRETEVAEAWTLVQRAERLRDESEQLAQSGDTAAAFRLLTRAESVLAEAKSLDPGWTEPVVLQGWIDIERARMEGSTFDARDPRHYRAALGHAREALELRPRAAAALELRGIARFQLSQTRGIRNADSLRAEAERDLRAAVDLEPSRARAWAGLSELYRMETKFAEAKLAAQRALEEDAFLRNAESVIWSLYQTSIELEQIDEAVRWCDEGNRRFPDRYYFHNCALFLLALPDGPEPEVERARRMLDKYLAATPPQVHDLAQVTGQLWVAAVMARRARLGADGEQADWADSARALIAVARQDVNETIEPSADYYEANVRLLLGERAEALDLLAEYLRALPSRKEYLAADWMFRELWSDPRFQDLVRDGAG